MVVKKGKFADVEPDVTGEPQPKKKGHVEYPRSIKKIASYGATVREMDCEGCGKYQKIMNVYVYPNNVLGEADYRNAPTIDEFIGDNSISKQSTRKHGEKDKALWSKHEGEVEGAAARHKKASKAPKRKIKNRR